MMYSGIVSEFPCYEFFWAWFDMGLSSSCTHLLSHFHESGTTVGPVWGFRGLVIRESFRGGWENGVLPSGSFLSLGALIQQEEPARCKVLKNVYLEGVLWFGLQKTSSVLLEGGPLRWGWGTDGEIVTNDEKKGRKGHPHVFWQAPGPSGETDPNTPSPANGGHREGSSLVEILVGPGSPSTWECGMDNAMCKHKESDPHFLFCLQTTFSLYSSSWGPHPIIYCENRSHQKTAP